MAFGILYGLRVCGIYKITNTKNAKFYIGSSVQIESRIFKHLAQLRKGQHNNSHMQAAFALYGEDAFDFELVELCSKGQLLAREQHHIDSLQPEYNICRFAGNTLGVLHTDAAKAKMTAANMGNKRMLGKRHTDESKRMMSIHASQRVQSPESNAKRAAALKGNTHTLGVKLSDDHRAIVVKKLSDSWNGVAGVKPRSREDAAQRARDRWADPAWKAAQAEKIRIGKAKRLAEKGNHFGAKAHNASQLENSQRQ